MSIGARATGKIAFLGAVASEHLGLVLLATVEDRARVWRWRRPLAFLAHGSTALVDGVRQRSCTFAPSEFVNFLSFCC